MASSPSSESLLRRVREAWASASPAYTSLPGIVVSNKRVETSNALTVYQEQVHKRKHEDDFAALATRPLKRRKTFDHTPVMLTSEAYVKEKESYLEFLTVSDNGRQGKSEEIRTTPLFSLQVKHVVDEQAMQNTTSLVQPFKQLGFSSYSQVPTFGSVGFPPPPTCGKGPPQQIGKPSVLPQYGLLGFSTETASAVGSYEPIMLNTNAPNSTFICGSQGSGKSYTLSCMLENFLLPTTGSIPLAGVVFHYDLDCASSVAEVAHLSSRGIPVNVYVSQSNQRALQSAYNRIGQNVKVRPLLLRSADLSIDRIHKLMALSEREGGQPLYMEVVQRILRHMAIHGSNLFDYKGFRNLLAQENFTKDQMSPMNLRFALLESFMHEADLPAPPPRAPAGAQHGNNKKPNPPTQVALNKNPSNAKIFDLQPGTLTIVDLSDPFIDASTVCMLFEICLGLIKQQHTESGLVVALDEAHKFMNASAAANNFTERLLTTIREQRHNATRVIIATQEPTIDPRLLDLCSTSIIHRFSSPAWFTAIKGHLGGASSMVASNEERNEIFERILGLDVGESLVFSPNSFVGIDEEGEPRKLSSEILKMKTRLRLGADGGMSVLASQLR